MKAFRQIFQGVLLLSVSAALRGATPVKETFRGGRVEWARLQTASAYWDRHSENDGKMLDLMRRTTSLNIDSVWRPARAGDLNELCRYPFLYSENIAMLSGTESSNVAEYLRRGGFLLIDACANVQVTPSPERFFRQQIEVLERSFPDLRIATLDPNHEVFSIYFKMKEYPPQARTPGNHYWVDGATIPLRGLYSGDRMIAIVSLNGFQCGWTGFGGPQTAVDCIEMVTNIYIYAMTR